MKQWTARRAASAALMSMTVAGPIRAEPQVTPPAADGASLPRANLSLSARFGVSTAPFYTANFPSVRGHALVATLSGRYPISATEELGMHLPGALASIEQPAGAYVDEATWGNPTLFVTHRRALAVGHDRALRWFGRVGVSLPLAERGASGALLSNRALAIASALEGWCEPEAYSPGRLSVAPSGGLHFSSPPWTFEASLELPLLIEAVDAHLPEDSDAHAVGFAQVIHVGLGVQVARWLIPSLNADLVINAVPPVESAHDPLHTAQFVLRPGLSFALNRRLSVSADFVAPIAGALGGSTYSGSLLLTTLP
jgi:hypothetical protein